jgi:AraC-like DNA-binding protein
MGAEMLEIDEFFRVPGVEVAKLKADGNSSFPRHTHAEYVISANLSGCENIWVDGKSLSASGQSATVYNPNAIQSSSFDSRAGDAKFISLYIEPTTLMNIAEENGWLPNSSPPDLRQGVFADGVLYRSIVDTYEAIQSDSEGDLDAALTDLVHVVLGRGTRNDETSRSVLSKHRLRMVIDFMKSNLTAPVSLDTLAEVSAISKFHLAKSFKAHFGIPPAKYHMQLRLIEARRCLRGREDVQDVAYDLGFYDQSHFINAFRKVLGVSPLRFASAARSPTRRLQG